MPRPDHYVVLGVPRSATAAEVKGAYRRLAHRYHPDKNGDDPNATRRFHAILKAYEILNDPTARVAYDRGEAGQPSPERGPGTGARAAEPPPTRARPAPPSAEGAPVHASTTLSFAEVLTGTVRALDVGRDSVCLACHGSGASVNSAWIACRSCTGGGYVPDSEGVFAYRRLCPQCHGTGKMATRPCRACRGRTVVPSTAALRVRIPSGLHEGAVMRFAQQGHAGPFDGGRGDLLLAVTIQADPRFTRDGADLRCTVQLTPWQAALGAVVPVDLPDGVVNVRVRSGTQPNAVMRLPGRGLPRMPRSETRGDCYLCFTVAVPPQLTAAQREMYERLAHLDGETAPARPRLRDRLLSRIRRRP